MEKILSLGWKKFCPWDRKFSVPGREKFLSLEWKVFCPWEEKNKKKTISITYPYHPA